MINPHLGIDMQRYIGKTVTIFTTSGGISGAGFTGVLSWVDERVVKLITRIGAPPACPLGSTCTGFDEFGGAGFANAWGPWGGGFGGGFGCGNRCNEGFGPNLLGSITEIPMHAIASFTHNAI